MRCWACPRTIRFSDEICELPIVEAIVHRTCYEREVRQRAAASITLSQYLAQRRAA